MDAKRGRSICSKETTTRYLAKLVEDGRIERFDTAILKPQTIELGGFILIQGSQPQIDTLRRDEDFEVWVTLTGSEWSTRGSTRDSPKRPASTSKPFGKPA